MLPARTARLPSARGQRAARLARLLPAVQRHRALAQAAVPEQPQGALAQEAAAAVAAAAVRTVVDKMVVGEAVPGAVSVVLEVPSQAAVALLAAEVNAEGRAEEASAAAAEVVGDVEEVPDAS